MPIPSTIVGAIVLAIIGIIVFMVLGQYKNEGYISGYWTGTPSFLETSELSEFQLFISPRSSSFTRDGHILIVSKDANILLNAPMKFRDSSHPFDVIQKIHSGFHTMFKTYNDLYTNKNITLDISQANILPNVVNISVSTLNGLLSLYNDSKIYAILEKDHSASALAKTTYNSGL